MVLLKFIKIIAKNPHINNALSRKKEQDVLDSAASRDQKKKPYRRKGGKRHDRYRHIMEVTHIARQTAHAPATDSADTTGATDRIDIVMICRDDQARHSKDQGVIRCAAVFLCHRHRKRDDERIHKDSLVPAEVTGRIARYQGIEETPDGSDRRDQKR